MGNGGSTGKRSDNAPSAAEAQLSVQRELRRNILDDASGPQWAQARDLAAHMLLHLDSPLDCSRIASRWIREAFRCDRADIGLGSPSDQFYAPGFAESRSPDDEIVSIAGLSVNNRDKGVRALWFSERPLVYADLSQESRFGTELRRWFLKNGVRSKLAWSISNRGAPLGLICIDWIEQPLPWSSALVDRFQDVCDGILNPIIGSSFALNAAYGCGDASDSGLRSADGSVHDADITCLLKHLSDAELRVAQLAACGLRYKEIAFALDRSFSTIDHQLRSVRTKLNVRNQAELVGLLARYAPKFKQRQGVN
ncbi:LuxR C-terminal-related transcriptional regulator [Oceanibacterium hippocampi]|uniref:Bacterial regulatory proteins, luxR family n=1 Tax=Oceanibacterium hippocampi TaxID=745714 RepID=A0A1Y5TVZ7_9PROT|nr:LuxR C-terminal-related transcriptional regulator [Oceanibacterium hippocampi]SLN74673.1 Bacterial regulatory proteins, luxR family [Oceanibacterium hippocampi]